MVSRRHDKIMEYGKGLLSVILLAYFSTTSLAETLTPGTPIKEGNYETPHQGIIHVHVTLFNVPCNLSVLKAQPQTVLLTDCGAGKNFTPHQVIFPRTATPAKLQFIDVKEHSIYPRQSVSLQNGHNTVALPPDVTHKKSLRLEVNYD